MKSNFPLRLAVLYFVVAILWIFVSDRVVTAVVPATLRDNVQTIKGFGFVFVSAIALFFIMRFYHRHIRKTESEYRQLFKDNPHPMWVYDTKSLKFLAVNNATINKYKFSKEEFRQIKVTDIRPEEDRASLEAFVQVVKDQSYHDSGIWRHMDKEGKHFFVRVASHSTRFEHHKARVVLAIDVEDQIQAQKKLQLSETKLKGLINNSDDLIWMIDSHGIIVTANEAFRKKFMQFTGITVELSKKIDVRQLAGMDFTRNWNTYFHQAFRGKHLKVEEEVKGENGSEYFEIILNPMHNDNKEIFGVGCFARDITERKKTENQIREQISRLKEVAWIQSHELRKPVANILGLLSLLKTTPPNTDNNELLDHMDTSCHELDAIVKKIVDKTSTPEERSSI